MIRHDQIFKHCTQLIKVLLRVVGVTGWGGLDKFLQRIITLWGEEWMQDVVDHGEVSRGIDGAQQADELHNFFCQGTREGVSRV